MYIIQVPSQPLSSTAAFFNITTRVRSVPGQAAQAVIAVRPPHTVHMLSPVGNVIYVCMYVCSSRGFFSAVQGSLVDVRLSSGSCSNGSVLLNCDVMGVNKVPSHHP